MLPICPRYSHMYGLPLEHDQPTKDHILKANQLSFSKNLPHQLLRAAEIGAGLHVHPLHNAKIRSYLVLHGECACCHNNWRFMCVPSYRFWRPLFPCIYSPPLIPVIYHLTFPQWSLSIYGWALIILCTLLTCESVLITIYFSDKGWEVN